MAKQPIIYLDYAAATPLDPKVLQAMQPYFTDNFYNPSATYRAGLDAHKDLEAARAKVAHWLGARSSEIIFTAGGTEANNLALFGLANRYERAHIVSSQLEHESILQPLEYLNRQGWGCSLVRPSPAGLIDPETVAAAVNDETVLVSIGYANNEIGTVQPLREIARALTAIRDDRRQRGIKQPLLMHTDACQAANYLDLHAARLGVDLMTLNGGKIYGPKQVGALYIKAGTMLEPIIFGGGQERNLRSGTENAAGTVGFAAALDTAQAMRRDEANRLHELQKQFIGQLQAAIPDVVINGSLKHRLPNNVHITIPGQDNERLLIQLDGAGILAAAGSACSASDQEPSHVLRAIGLSDDEAQASLRFTMGRPTTSEMIKHTVKILSQLI